MKSMKRPTVASFIAIAFPIVTTVMLAAILLIVNSFRFGANERSERETTKSMGREIQSFIDPISKIARDYNNWDDVFIAAKDGDVNFISQNYGITAIYGELFDGAMMFGGPFERPLSWSNRAESNQSQEFLNKALMSEIERKARSIQPGMRKTIDFLLVNQGGSLGS